MANPPELDKYGNPILKKQPGPLSLAAGLLSETPVADASAAAAGLPAAPQATLAPVAPPAGQVSGQITQAINPSYAPAVNVSPPMAPLAPLITLSPGNAAALANIQQNASLNNIPGITTAGVPAETLPPLAARSRPQTLAENSAGGAVLFPQTVGSASTPARNSEIGGFLGSSPLIAVPRLAQSLVPENPIPNQGAGGLTAQQIIAAGGFPAGSPTGGQPNPTILASTAPARTAPAVLPGPTGGGQALVHAADNAILAASAQAAGVAAKQAATQAAQGGAPAPGAAPAMLQGRNNGAGFDLAAQNARMQAALQAAQAPAAPAPASQAGYAPQSEYGTPGPGMSRAQFDLSNAIDNIQTRTGKNRREGINQGAVEAAKLLGARIDQQAAVPRADALASSQIGEAATRGTLNQAYAGESTAKAANQTALTPSQIGLNLSTMGLHGAQAGEAQARGQQIGALTPSQITLNQAHAAYNQAQGAHAQAQASDIAARQPGMLQQQALANAGQATANEGSALAVKAAQQMEALHAKALTSGKPEDIALYSKMMQAQSGKGTGELTPEDKAKFYVALQAAHDKAFSMAPDAPLPPSPQQAFAALEGKVLPIEQNPQAQAIAAQLKAGKIKPDAARQKLMALGYQ